MKLRHNIIFLAINVACCYPSSGEYESKPATVFCSSESISPSVSMPLSYLDGSAVAKDNNFPEVNYPSFFFDTTVLDYLAADHDDTLAPFTSDVKDSFKSLEAERRAKEYSARQDCISSQDTNQPTLQECHDAQINNLLSYNAANTSDVNVGDGYSQTVSEEDGETSDGTSCQLNVHNKNIELTNIATNSTEMSVTTQRDSSEHSDDNVNIEPKGIPTESTESSVTIQEDSSEHSDDNENKPTGIPTESTEYLVTIQEDSSEHSDDNKNKPTGIPTESTESTVIIQEDSSEHSDDNENKPTGIPTESTESLVTIQEDSSEHSDDNENKPTGIPTESTESSVTTQEDSLEH